VLIPTDLLVAGGFYTFAVAALAGAVGLIVARNVFHSALFLVVTLGSVAGVFVILGADFLAAVQILVYVGAVMILILFAVMLTPLRAPTPTLTSPGQAIAGIAIAILVFGATAATLLTARWPHAGQAPINVPTTEAIGRSLLTTFVLPFEIASVLLLVAMIGAIVIARED
jgi:NADH-quinone oxidoreductase subunit J